jgi:hypothetical protein
LCEKIYLNTNHEQGKAFWYGRVRDENIWTTVRVEFNEKTKNQKSQLVTPSQ